MPFSKYLNKYKELNFLEKHQIALSITGTLMSVTLGVASILISVIQWQSAEAEGRLTNLEEHRANQMSETKRSRQAFSVKIFNSSASTK